MPTKGLAAMRKVICHLMLPGVHFMRNLLVHAPKGRGGSSALVRTIFAQTSEKAARAQW